MSVQPHSQQREEGVFWLTWGRLRTAVLMLASSTEASNSAVHFWHIFFFHQGTGSVLDFIYFAFSFLFFLQLFCAVVFLHDSRNDPPPLLVKTKQNKTKNMVAGITCRHGRFSWMLYLMFVAQPSLRSFTSNSPRRHSKIRSCLKFAVTDTNFT